MALKLFASTIKHSRQPKLGNRIFCLAQRRSNSTAAVAVEAAAEIKLVDRPTETVSTNELQGGNFTSTVSTPVQHDSNDVKAPSSPPKLAENAPQLKEPLPPRQPREFNDFKPKFNANKPFIPGKPQFDSWKPAENRPFANDGWRAEEKRPYANDGWKPGFKKAPFAKEWDVPFQDKPFYDRKFQYPAPWERRQNADFEEGQFAKGNNPFPPTQAKWVPKTPAPTPQPSSGLPPNIPVPKSYSKPLDSNTTRANDSMTKSLENSVKKATKTLAFSRGFQKFKQEEILVEFSQDFYFSKVNIDNSISFFFNKLCTQTNVVQKISLSELEFNLLKKSIA